VLLRAMLRTMRCTRCELNTRVATTALRALRRLSTIASALGHQEERILDDVSTRGDMDACSRASRAKKVYKKVYSKE